MKRKVLSVLMAITMMVALVGCGSKSTVTEQPAEPAEEPKEEEVKEEEPAVEEEKEEITVGVILKTLSSEYWGYVAAGVNEAAADLGVKVNLQGPASETAYDEQNNMIETMLSGGLDAFVISPLQSDSVASVIGDVSIPVLTVDTDAEIPGKLSFIGTGNEAAAYEGGVFAAKAAGDGAKAVIIGGVEGNATSDARQAGFTKALEDNGVEVVAVQYAQSNPDTAANVMENMITAQGGDIQIVCCHNDDTAVGAANAIKQSGLEDVIIVGFDGCQSGVQNVIDGNITATCAQSAYTMGYKSVEAAVSAVKGETIESFVDTGCTVVSSENAEEYMSTLVDYLK